MKLEVPEIIKFEVSLEEIINACRLILQHTNDQEVRTALNTMFSELKKADDSLIKEVLVPLFAIETQNDFNREFGHLRSKFKAIQFGGKGLLSQINCGIVTAKLDELKKSEAWKKYIPLLNRSIVRLELVVDNWIANDAELYQADQKMLSEINKFMDEIAKQKESDPPGAFAELKDGLKGIEDSFLLTKKHLADLEVLSSQL